MKFEIIPNVGAGKLLYGMPMALVRRTVDSRFVTFRRGSEKTESEHYVSLGLIACYDEQNRLQALEFARPAQPVLNGIDLLALDLSQARRICRAAGGPMHDYEEGPISKVLGIGVWAPDYKENPRAPLESVIAFGPGYYENYPDGL